MHRGGNHLSGRRGPGSRLARYHPPIEVLGRRLGRGHWRDLDRHPEGETVPGLLALTSPPVLTSRLTGSSGEGVVMAFRGRPDSRSFGEPTAGVPTGNAGYPLSDRAELYLTEGIGVDRTGATYQARIQPDPPVATDWTRYGSVARGTLRPRMRRRAHPVAPPRVAAAQKHRDRRPARTGGGQACCRASGKCQ
jgi:hypothetical protein